MRFPYELDLRLSAEGTGSLRIVTDRSDASSKATLSVVADSTVRKSSSPRRVAAIALRCPA